MAKKQGGTFFGNLLAKVGSTVTGGVLGGNRSALLSSGNSMLINAPTIPAIHQPAIDLTAKTLSVIQGNNDVNTSPIIPTPTLGDKINEVLKTSDGNSGIAFGQNLGLDQSMKIPVFLGLGLLAYKVFFSRGR